MILWPKYIVIFEFASAHLRKGVCLVVSLLKVKEARVGVMTYTETPDFATAKDSWDIN